MQRLTDALCWIASSKDARGGNHHIYVDGGVVAVSIKEVRAGAGLLEEALGVGGEPVSVALDKCELLLFEAGSHLSLQTLKMFGAGFEGRCDLDRGPRELHEQLVDALSVG